MLAQHGPVPEISITFDLGAAPPLWPAPYGLIHGDQPVFIWGDGLRVRFTPEEKRRAGSP